MGAWRTFKRAVQRKAGKRSQTSGTLGAIHVTRKAKR